MKVFPNDPGRALDAENGLDNLAGMADTPGVQRRRLWIFFSNTVRGRPTVGQQTLDLPIGVRIPAPQPIRKLNTFGPIV